MITLCNIFFPLPVKWSKEKKWPIVVIIESANKEYKENALRFVQARKEMPFILIAPYNVNNSRSGRRDPRIFPYSTETWDIIDKMGDCKFNMDGITQIVKDVRDQYNGEQNILLPVLKRGHIPYGNFYFNTRKD
jgi:hypothetical protein